MIKNNNLFNSLAPLFLIAFISVFISSCEKEELPIKAHVAGDVVAQNVKMGEDYRYQLFFDLGTNTTVKKNLKTDWDLAFETEADGFHVILNTAKSMFAANTNQNVFSAITDTAGLVFKWDEASGSMDSTAIGDWTNNKNVFVIERGYDEEGTHLGFKKIVFQSVDKDSYSIKFSNLDGSEESSMEITKNTDFNFTFVSLEATGNVVSIEPPKENWDLVFTQYTNVFYDQTPPLPYLVSGAIMNRNKVQVCKVFDKEFKDISIDDIVNYVFSSNINTIGYDWKFYSFKEGQYTVLTKQNYIVKSTNNKYFKIHFIDFYDNLGSKGTPTFEFQEL